MNQTARDFFQQLYEGCTEGYITLWERQNKETYWFHVTDYEKAAETATYLAEMKKDVYFGVGLRKEELHGKKRGSSEDILLIPGVWMDIDIQSNAHAENALPKSIEEAKKILSEFPIAPTFLVHSGHGLHAYWKFTGPTYTNTPKYKEEGKELLTTFQDTIRGYALNYGWKLDNTADLARVLRVPGTVNYKSNPVDVSILKERTNQVVDVGNLQKYFCSPSSSSSRKHQTKKEGDFSPSSIQPIQEGCAWMKHCSDNASTLPEPQWYAMLSVLGRCEKGEALAHEWSQSYPKYSEKETNKKLVHALRDAGPATCKRISDLTNNIHCRGCKWQGVIKSPITLGSQRKQSEESKEEVKLLDSVLDGVPVKGLIKPKQYHVSMDGIFEPVKEELKQICSVPVILSRRLKNVNTDEEKVELSFYKYNKWNKVITKRSVAMNRSAIIELSDTGLPVHSENSKELVKYLAAFDTENLDMPITRSVSHMGWVDDQYDRFLPGIEDGIQLDTAKSMGKGYKSKGTLDEWIENIKPILTFPIARFLLASSFASPLLRLMKHRNFLVYPFGGTRGGKTAALKVALSVWGNPEEIMTTFNSTRNALERKVAFYSDLPMGIDERQVVGDQQGFVESIAYMMGNGQSRGRATKDGMQEELTWHNICIATGEEPLSNESSSGGVKSRTLELYGKPIDNEELASQMHLKAEETYGVAGPEFIKKVIQEIQRDPAAVKNEFKAIRSELKTRFPNNIDSHVTSVSAVLLADVYMNKWLFGTIDHQAVNEAISMGKHILELLDKKEDLDDAKRAYEAFMSWFAVHQFYFNIESKDLYSGKEIYGWEDDDGLNIYPTQFKKAMKELGFTNDLRIRKDWVDLGWMASTNEGSQKRTTVKKWNKISRKLERVISIKLNTE